MDPNPFPSDMSSQTHSVVNDASPAAQNAAAHSASSGDAPKHINSSIEDYTSDYFYTPFWESVRTCVMFGLMWTIAIIFVILHYALFSVPAVPNMPPPDNSVGWGASFVYMFISIFVSHGVMEHGWRWFVDQMT